jgi:hypothetical protein
MREGLAQGIGNGVDREVRSYVVPMFRHCPVHVQSTVKSPITSKSSSMVENVERGRSAASGSGSCFLSKATRASPLRII